jgi:hypothetical protein
VDELPQSNQQPDPLFAAVKYLYGPPRDWRAFRHLLLEHKDENNIELPPFILHQYAPPTFFYRMNRTPLPKYA